MLTAFKACRKKECGPARIGATNIDGLKRNKSELGIKTTIIFRKKYGVSKNISPSRNFTGEGKKQTNMSQAFPQSKRGPDISISSPAVLEPKQWWLAFIFCEISVMAASFALASFTSNLGGD